MNAILTNNIKAQVSSMMNNIMDGVCENLYFIPFNQESIILTYVFDMVKQHKNITMTAYTDFYDMEKQLNTIAHNKKSKFVIFVTSPNPKKSTKITFFENNLDDFLSSLPHISCTTIFVEGNFLQMHEINCLIHTELLSYFDTKKESN